MKNKYTFFAFFILFQSYNLHAYLGPGMGAGLITSILGFVGAILLALFGVLYYPIKRALKNRKDKKELSKDSNDES